MIGSVEIHNFRKFSQLSDLSLTLNAQNFSFVVQPPPPPEKILQRVFLGNSSGGEVLWNFQGEGRYGWWVTKFGAAFTTSLFDMVSWNPMIYKVLAPSHQVVFSPRRMKLVAINSMIEFLLPFQISQAASRGMGSIPKSPNVQATFVGSGNDQRWVRCCLGAFWLPEVDLWLVQQKFLLFVSPTKFWLLKMAKFEKKFFAKQEWKVETSTLPETNSSQVKHWAWKMRPSFLGGV